MTPPSTPRALGTATRFLVATLMMGAVALAIRARQRHLPEGLAEFLEEPRGSGETCEPVSACGPTIMQDLPSHPTLPLEASCRDAAYLCAGLAVRPGPLRVLRWRDRTATIRVRVEWPSHTFAREASRQQQGAVRGLRAWDGHPIRLTVDSDRQPEVESSSSLPTSGSAIVSRYSPERRPVAGDTSPVAPPASDRDPDFVLGWNVEPMSEEIGEAYTTWGTDSRHEGYGMAVTAVAVSTMTEWPGAFLTPLRRAT